MARVIGNPDARLLRVIESLDRRLRIIENRKTVVYYGPRSDDPEGDLSDIGPRTQVGDMGDGTFGIRVWDSAGSLTFDQTS